MVLLRGLGAALFVVVGVWREFGGCLRGFWLRCAF